MAVSMSVEIKSSEYRIKEGSGIRVRIAVTAATDVPTAVFGYRLSPASVQTGNLPEARFSHVCSPADLEDYPAATPGQADVPAWFRLPVVDVFVRSTHEADNFIAVVLEDLAKLKSSLINMATLNIVRTEVV